MSEQYTAADRQATMGGRIAALRRAAGLTQEQLAEQLGVTFQAVSKWENDLSCPDVLLLPRLAEIFGITLDALFGIEREAPCATEGERTQQTDGPARAEPMAEEQTAFTENDLVRPDGPVRVQAALPWQDDENLYAVVYQGHSLLRAQQVLRHAEKLQCLRLVMAGDVGNVQGYFDVEIHGSVDGDVAAGQNITCESVCGNVTAGAALHCGDIDGDVRVGGDMTAGAVCGDIEAGADVTCTEVDGDIDAAGSVTCMNVTGDVDAGNSVTCADVYGDVDAGNWVQCGNVTGDVDAGAAVQCGNVDGCVDAGASVTCAAVCGDIDAGGDVHFVPQGSDCRAAGGDSGEEFRAAFEARYEAEFEREHREAFEDEYGEEFSRRMRGYADRIVSEVVSDLEAAPKKKRPFWKRGSSRG